MVTEKYLSLMSYLYGKYRLNKDEMRQLNVFARLISSLEYDDDFIERFFDTPVSDDPAEMEGKN